MERVALYQKTNSKLNLILGVVWLLSGSAIFFIDTDKLNFFNYFSLPLGLLYIFLFFYQKRPFYSIKNNQIIKTQFPKRQFNLNNIQRINRNENGYKLISETQEDFKINTTILKEQDCIKLKIILETFEKKPSV